MKQAIRITAAFLLGLLFLPLTLTTYADDGYSTPGKGKGIPFDLHVPFDYHNYIGAGIAQKVFDYYDTSQGGCKPNTEVQEFTRTSIEGGTQTDMIRTRRIESVNPTDPSIVCQIRGFRYEDRIDRRALIARQGVRNGQSVTDIFKDPLTRLTSSMRIGNAWATASGITHSDSPRVTHVIEKGTLVGVEDVTVPAGTFTGCLRIQIERWSLFASSFNRVAWYCPGIGLTKHITMNFSDPANARTVRVRLRSYTPAS